MLPSEDAIWVAEELGRRFGLPRWQFAMTATDANRFVLRFARHLTGRPRIAVFDWCYHGTVDETLAVLEDGRVVPRPGAMGPQVDVALTTAVVPFNDLDALDRRLAEGDVACLLMEPALTNIGIVLPDEGYSEAVREITRKHDVLLVIDETHTLCAGPGGCTAAVGARARPAGRRQADRRRRPARGVRHDREVADRLTGPMLTAEADVSGVGGTLTANAMALSAARAALSSALREEDFAVAIPLAERFTDGVQAVIDRHGLPWNVQRLGCRAEYWFCPPPRDGAAAAAAVDEELERLMHLWALNRGVLLTPFHNMALFSPAHSEADVDRHTEVFGEAVDALRGLAEACRLVPNRDDTPSQAAVRDQPVGQTRTYARSVIVRPAARPLRSNLVTGRSSHRGTTPPGAAARRPAPRPSARRSRPSPWPAATWRRGPAATPRGPRTPGSPGGACGAASCARGRGRTSRARPARPDRSGAPSTRPRRPSRTARWSRPSRPPAASASAMPGRQTSRASTSYAARAGARAAVASPMPEPISTTSGASRPNQSRHRNPGSSTASSGITHLSWWASHASRCRGVNRLPRRA